MLRAKSGHPRTLRRVEAAPERPQAAEQILAEGGVWAGQPIKILSLPNGAEEDRYVRIEVANLHNEEYEINVVESPLGNPADHEFPEDLPTLLQRPEAVDLRSFYKEGRSVSGAMVTIPAERRVNIVLTLKGETGAPRPFDVLLYEHYSPDRHSPQVEGASYALHFNWMPRPQSGQLVLRLEPETVEFRQWNIGDNNPWFFRNWQIASRPLFNQPRCYLTIENANRLPVTVAPYLLETLENLPDYKRRLDLPTLTLQSGDVVEIPADLTLDKVSDIPKMTVQAFADVSAQGQSSPEPVKSTEKSTGQYVPFPRKIKDFAGAACATFLPLLFLMWLFVGIPIWVSPVRVAVPVVLADQEG